MFMVMFCGILLFYVYQHIQALRYGYRVEERRKEAYSLRMHNDRILMEIKHFTSLPRLEELAKTKLGLKVAGRQEIIVLAVQGEKVQDNKDSFLSSFSRILDRGRSKKE